eukprot:gene32156-36972_t
MNSPGNAQAFPRKPRSARRQSAGAGLMPEASYTFQHLALTSIDHPPRFQFGALNRRSGSVKRLTRRGLSRAVERGCYVTVPTPFEDREGMPVNEAALRAYVRFLIDSGLTADYATFLAGGAAGDFSTMSFDERVQV